MSHPSTILHRHWLKIAIVAVVVLLAIGARRWLPSKPENPRLSTPELALAALETKSLYFNGTARPWLLNQRPELLTAEDKDERSPRVRELAQAVANPKLFRQLDRRYRFDTVLLVGDPSQYRTLLDHLVETKDFALSYVDHTSVVFKRPATGEWTPAQLVQVRAQLGRISSREQAEFLALTATKLIAAHRGAEAKALLDQALALDSGSVEAWNALALYQMNRGEWAEAFHAANRALSIDRQHLGALATKTQIFYGSKKFDEAFALSKTIVGRLGDDPNALFKHAQIAHEAHAYKEEIATLNKLIARAEAEQRETTGYRLYLAQAYTVVGEGQPAIDNFRRVLADPELPEDQRKFSKESIERIKKRTGL